MNVSEFAARYNKMPHLIGDFPTPKARLVKQVVADLESDGMVISASGLVADIAAKWLIASGQPLALFLHQGSRCWVVKRVSDRDIEGLNV